MATEQITQGDTEQATAPDTERIIAAVNQLPLAERVRVLEAIAASVRAEVGPTAKAATSPQTANGTQPASAPPADIATAPVNDDDSRLNDREWWQRFERRRAELLKDVPPESALHELLGIARTTRRVPMTKEEEQAVIDEYLAEKYLR